MLLFRAVLKSEYPLVSVDGYQPIVDVFSGSERGQLKVLLALGTQVQVGNTYILASWASYRSFIKCVFEFSKIVLKRSVFYLLMEWFPLSGECFAKDEIYRRSCSWPSFKWEEWRRRDGGEEEWSFAFISNRYRLLMWISAT